MSKNNDLWALAAIILLVISAPAAYFFSKKDEKMNTDGNQKEYDALHYIIVVVIIGLFIALGLHVKGELDDYTKKRAEARQALVEVQNEARTLCQKLGEDYGAQISPEGLYIREKDFQTLEVKDPWGEPIRIVYASSIEKNLDTLQIISAGPDKTLSTEDDIVETRTRTIKEIKKEETAPPSETGEKKSRYEPLKKGVKKELKEQASLYIKSKIKSYFKKEE